MNQQTKEVLYSEYCNKCKYQNDDEACDKCNDCLNEPARVDSHKPLSFESKDA